MAQQRATGGAEQQESSRTPVGIDLGTQLGEESGDGLHFIENYQLVAMKRKKQVSSSQLGTVRFAFEIEENGLG